MRACPATVSSAALVRMYPAQAASIWPGTVAVKLTRTKITAQPPIGLKNHDLEQPRSSPAIQLRAWGNLYFSLSQATYWPLKNEKLLCNEWIVTHPKWKMYHENGMCAESSLYDWCAQKGLRSSNRTGDQIIKVRVWCSRFFLVLRRLHSGLIFVD